MEIENYTCNKCQRIFGTVNSFLTHVSRKYGLTSEQIYCELNNISEIQYCKCGCGTKVDFHTFTDGYWNYKRGHASDGSIFTKETKIKSEETYRKNLASGKTVRKKKERILVEKKFKCFLCESSYDSMESLAKHCVRSHELESKEFHLKYHNIKNEPKCECGCGEITQYLNSVQGYRRYRRGHAARVDNNYQTSKSIKNSQTTRKKLIKTGGWKPFNLISTGEFWSLGLTKETDVRIAKNVEIQAANEAKTHTKANKMREGRLSGTIKTLSGPESPQWKGGISSLGAFCRMSPKLYSEWKYPHLVRAGFKCEICGGNEKGLEVHHDKETYSEILRKFSKEFNWELSTNNRLELIDINPEIIELKNLIAKKITDYHIGNKVSGLVLCQECHGNIHNSYNFHK